MKGPWMAVGVRTVTHTVCVNICLLRANAHSMILSLHGNVVQQAMVPSCLLRLFLSVQSLAEVFYLFVSFRTLRGGSEEMKEGKSQTCLAETILTFCKLREEVRFSLQSSMHIILCVIICP